MTSAEAMREYVVKCGLPADLTVDDDTYLLSSKPIKIGDLNPDTEAINGEKKGLGYYVNLKYPYKCDGKEAKDDTTVYSGESGVFVVKDNRLVMLCPIYEVESVDWYEVKFVNWHGSVVSVTGHEETATIVLKNLEESFKYHTR